MITIVENQVIVFQPQENTDLQFGNPFSEQIAQMLPEKDQVWIFDLVNVNFMDSSGLVTLVNGYKKASQHSCRFVLTNVQAQVRVTLEVTQLDSVFEIIDNYEDIFLKPKSSDVLMVG